MSQYTDERAKALLLSTRSLLRELPDVCTDFIQAIEPTTQPLTRFAYANDLKTFCEYLVAEVPRYGSKTPFDLSVDDLGRVTARDIRNYLDYLGYYVKSDEERHNSEAGKMRKLASLRSFYDFMFKNELIPADVSKLVEMPKRHEKAIIRLEIDEAMRMLDTVETGNGLTNRQKAYGNNTKLRDLAIITLFLGTGIRVSELVGINISDVDFNVNGFLVTRKGGNQAILYFPEEVAKVLQDYLAVRKEIQAQPDSEDALFLSLQNKRITVRAVQYIVKKYASVAAPLKQHLSPHKLRSTFGTNLYHETGDIYLVADVLGHSDVNTTRRHYAAMSEDRRRMAAQHVHIRTDGTETSADEKAPSDDQDE